MKFGAFALGVGLGFVTWWLAYRAAKPFIRESIQQAVFDELDSLPSGALDLLDRTVGRGVKFAIATAVASAVERKLP